MSEAKLLYRPEEAAEALGISRARLYQLMAEGEIGSVKIGASRRIPAVDLERYVSQLRAHHEKGAAAEPNPLSAAARRKARALGSPCSESAA
jgi:excisionase family DNA binding protein